MSRPFTWPTSRPSASSRAVGGSPSQGARVKRSIISMVSLPQPIERQVNSDRTCNAADECANADTDWRAGTAYQSCACASGHAAEKSRPDAGALLDGFSSGAIRGRDVVDCKPDTDDHKSLADLAEPRGRRCKSRV